MSLYWIEKRVRVWVVLFLERSEDVRTRLLHVFSLSFFSMLSVRFPKPEAEPDLIYFTRDFVSQIKTKNAALVIMRCELKLLEICLDRILSDNSCVLL
jgi:hypothetical protein